MLSVVIGTKLCPRSAASESIVRLVKEGDVVLLSVCLEFLEAEAITRVTRERRKNSINTYRGPRGLFFLVVF